MERKEQCKQHVEINLWNATVVSLSPAVDLNMKTMPVTCTPAKQTGTLPPSLSFTQTPMKKHTHTQQKTALTLYFACVPDWRSDSMFPGSKYAMLIKNPGPVNAHNLRKLKPVCNSKNLLITLIAGLNAPLLK